MCIRHRAGACSILCHPLMCASRTLREFPFILEQVLEKIVAPLGRRRGPGDLEATADRIPTNARLEFASPPEALLLEGSCFRLCAHIGSIASSVRFAEGVSAGDERNRLFIVHRHAAE